MIRTDASGAELRCSETEPRARWCPYGYWPRPTHCRSQSEYTHWTASAACLAFRKLPLKHLTKQARSVSPPLIRQLSNAHEMPCLQTGSSPHSAAPSHRLVTQRSQRGEGSTPGKISIRPPPEPPVSPT